MRCKYLQLSSSFCKFCEFSEFLFSPKISNSYKKFKRTVVTSSTVRRCLVKNMWTSRAASLRIGQCLRTTASRQKRSLHTVLKLPYENLEPSVNGIYPLFSAEGFRAAWTERQEYLVSQVNRITQGMLKRLCGESDVRHRNCPRRVIQFDPFECSAT